MLHNAMLAALGVAAAGTADAKRLVGHCSAPANDRSQTTQLFPVRKNLIIFYGATAGAAGPMQWATAGISTRTEHRRQHDAAWRRRRFDWQRSARRMAATFPATLPQTSKGSLQCSSASDPPCTSRRSWHVQNGLVEIFTSMCNTSVMAFIRRSAERQQVGVAAAAMLLANCGSRARAAAAGAGAGAFSAVHAGVAAAAVQLRKARVVTVSSTYHSRAMCARAVCTYAGTPAYRQ